MCHFLINLRALARSAAIWYAFLLSFRLTPLDAHDHSRLTSEFRSERVGNSVVAIAVLRTDFSLGIPWPWMRMMKDLHCAIHAARSSQHFDPIQLFLPPLICTSLEFQIVHYFLGTRRAVVFCARNEKVIWNATFRRICPSTRFES